MAQIIFNVRLYFQISEEMSGAVNLADTAVAEITDLTMRKSSFQTDFIRNENRVKSAQAAAEAAKDQAASANSELYQLNNGFKNVSSSLEVKISTIGGAKDMAVDLQRRANDLASSASNKLANLFGKDYKISTNCNLNWEFDSLMQ